MRKRFAYYGSIPQPTIPDPQQGVNYFPYVYTNPNANLQVEDAPHEQDPTNRLANDFLNMIRKMYVQPTQVATQETELGHPLSLDSYMQPTVQQDDQQQQATDDQTIDDQLQQLQVNRNRLIGDILRQNYLRQGVGAQQQAQQSSPVDNKSKDFLNFLLDRLQRQKRLGM
jgi:hypothetical protein